MGMLGGGLCGDTIDGVEKGLEKIEKEALLAGMAGKGENGSSGMLVRYIVPGLEGTVPGVIFSGAKATGAIFCFRRAASTMRVYLSDPRKGLGLIVVRTDPPQSRKEI